MNDWSNIVVIALMAAYLLADRALSRPRMVMPREGLLSALASRFARGPRTDP